ncbi:MAG: hypothetical protein HZB47_02905 [Nitrosomonadales bacterium]|nr:hypothetical protein [Nitrosomonadales bacterium]
MSIGKTCLKSTPVYLAGACAVLLVYGFLFPVLNWPDEYRNVLLLQEGRESGYAFIYGHFVRFVLQVADTLFGLNELTDVLAAVRPGSGYHMIHGELHYKTIASVPAVYYFAKFANFALAGAFAAAVVLYLCRTGNQAGNKDVQVFLLSLCFPSVAYGVMQISTDILFILFSLLPFYLRGRTAALAFAAVMALLVVEDRSFLLLSVFVLLREFYGAFLTRRIAAGGWRARLGWLLLFSALTMLAALLVTHALANPKWLNLLQPGMGDGVALALEYTHAKSYNPAVSLVVLYAGFIILPGATEFFVALAPLYLLLLFVFYRFMVFCLSGRYGEAGTRAYLALLSVLTLFFFLTGVVHVFESGRYYLYLVPYLVHALLFGALRFKGFAALRAEWVMLFGFTLVAIAVTLLAYAMGA